MLRSVGRSFPWHGPEREMRWGHSRRKRQYLYFAALIWAGQTNQQTHPPKPTSLITGFPMGGSQKGFIFSFSQFERFERSCVFLRRKSVGYVLQSGL